jgi:hypothetical protein
MNFRNRNVRGRRASGLASSESTKTRARSRTDASSSHFKGSAAPTAVMWSCVAGLLVQHGPEHLVRSQSRRVRKYGKTVAAVGSSAENADIHVINLEGDFVDSRPPASIRHRSSARPAAGNDDGFVEGLSIFLLADRIHRPKFRQQRVDQ